MFRWLRREEIMRVTVRMKANKVSVDIEYPPGTSGEQAVARAAFVQRTLSRVTGVGCDDEDEEG